MSPILTFIILTAAYWLTAAAWFELIQKPLFGLLNTRSSALGGLSGSSVGAAYRHGFVSDAIVASYLTAIPLIIGALATFIGRFPLLTVLGVYNALIALAIGLIATSDALLYGFWKYKLDASVFAYLRSIRGATASVSTIYLVTAVAGWLLVSATYFAAAQGVCALVLHACPAPAVTSGWGYAAVALMLIAAVAGLFVIIRGLKIRPNNPSVVYFSPEPYLNHLALNPAYNLIYSLTTNTDFKSQFREMTDEECRAITAPLFPVSGTPHTRILRTQRPNIMMVVWESFGAEFMGELGGMPDVTPCTDALAREGVLFTDCVAGSFRTDRGLVCLLSGYLGQPTTSIIRYTRKLPSLPGLPRTLAAAGYETVAIHGGDLTIMHKSDYYLASGHRRLVAQRDMPSGLHEGKWGIHDGDMMDFAADEAGRLTSGGKPWMITLQTLSSHEPFEVPYARLADPVANSFAYTDASLGRMVERLKASGAWDNMVLIVVADHGLNSDRSAADRRNYAHIPLIMAGGAVDGPRRIDTLMSQTDIAATLLGQMGLDHSDFTFSRDILADTYIRPMGFHTYNNGFLIVTPEGYTEYDNVAGTAVKGADPGRELTGKAILQHLYDDIDRR